MANQCCSEGGSTCCAPGMKIAIVFLLLLAIGGVLYTKYSDREKTRTAEPTPAVSAEPTPAVSPAPTNPAVNAATPIAQPLEKQTPKLLDLGATKCIPCKMMAPILEEMKKEYQGKLEVVFIDVWEKPQEAENYKITTIPTQIFYSPDGKELFRHVGFFSKEDILAKWKELGFDFGTNTTGTK